MITPSFGLTATERVLPKLALDFTTAVLDPRITFTRTGATATRTNASGSLETVNADTPRFDYSPTTLTCLGLLMEETRTNVLTNSLINGTTLATQSVTVSATPYTLSFYGTGSIVLSGAFSSTVNGAGAYPTRTTFTFTPTAGTLTITVSGTVQYAQLEAGSFATSFIPTDATVGGIARNVDKALMTGSNLTNWYVSTVGTLAVTANPTEVNNDGNVRYAAVLYDTSTGFTNAIRLERVSALWRYVKTVAGASTVASGAWAQNVIGTIVAAYQNANSAGSFNASAAASLAGNVPAAASYLGIGSTNAGLNSWCGHIRGVRYWPQRLTNAEVQAFSK